MDRIYAQHPLSPDNEEIRLLHVYPDYWDAPIKARFSVASLSRFTPEYVALSYVWGDASKTLPCFVDLEGFRITENLHSALRRLRAKAQTDGAPLVIWADALCINQALVEEKNQQVRLMGKIYSSCRYVLVWLGELPGYRHRRPFGVEDPDSNLIALNCHDVLGHLAAGGHLTDIFPFDSDISRPHFRAVLKAFWFLGRNAWFTRRWVVQEAVMAPSVQVVFGTESVNLGVLTRAMETIASHTQEQCCLSSLPGHYDLRHAIRGFVQKFIPIQRLRYLRGSPLSLMDLCLEFLDCRVSEEHDHVYALLSMANPPPRLIPNYRSPIRDLFTAICISHITESATLHALHLAGLRQETDGLPSWAIDWKAVGRGVMSTWNQISEHFNASGTSAQAPLVSSHRCLHLAGWEVDQVEAFSEPLGHIKPPHDTFLDILHNDRSFQNWRSYIISKAHEPGSSYPSGDTWASAWWRTLCADSCWGANSARRMTQRDVNFFSLVISRHTKLVSIGDQDAAPSFPQSDSFETDDGRKVPADAHYNDIMGMSAGILQGSTLFYTKNGYIGLGRGPVCAGDHIYIIPGCRTPMLLRPGFPAGHDRTDPFYLIVGFCFIHGMMDGEGVGKEADLESMMVL